MKNKTRKRLLTIALAIAIMAVFMPATALAEGDENVTSYAEFLDAIGNTGVTTINVTGDFALTEDVTIDREVTITCTSDPGYTITTGDYSIIITGSDAVVTISGNLTVTGQEPVQVTGLGTADISGGSIEAAGEGSVGVYVDDYSAVTVSGGTITAIGAGGSGVWVDNYSAVTVSGGTITAAGDESAGVFVRYDGTADISGGTITAAGAYSGSVYVGSIGSADISGGTITATGSASSGIYMVNSGPVTISGDPEISGDIYGVYVDSGTAEISGGTVTATTVGGAIGIYVINGGTVTISGESDIIGDENGVYVEEGTAHIIGGAITTARSGTSSVYVQGSSSIVTVSGGVITATGAGSYGVYVYGGGTVTVSDGIIMAEGSGTSCVYSSGGDSTVTISGGTITAVGDDTSSVYVQGGDSTVTVSGGTIGATGTDSCGLYVGNGSTATISDEAKISGDAYGVYIDVGWNEVNVSVSADITISSGVYNYKGDAFLTGLPGPVAMTAGQTKTVELAGVDETINFEVVDGDTDPELVASIAGSKVTLAPLETTEANTYNLVLYAPYESNNFNLIIPVTVAVADTNAPVLSAPGASDVTYTAAKLNFTSGEAGTYYYLVYPAADAAPDKANVKAQGTAVVKGTGAALAAANTVSVSSLAPSTAYKAYVVVEDAAGNISDVATINITTTAAPDTVIDIAAIAGVTAPVRGAAPVTAITATDQYTGTVSWSPAVADNRFAAEKVYTATITLTAKAGYTLTGVAANFFTVAGAISVNNDADSGVITAVFPATATVPDSDGNDSGGSGGGAPSTPSTPEYEADVDVSNGSNTTLSVIVDINSGSARVNIGTGNDFMSGGQTTVVTVPSISDVDTYTLSIPVPSLTTSDEQGTLAFKTDTGTVSVPSNMLTDVMMNSGSKAEISIGQGDKSNLPKDVKNAIGDRPLVQLTLSIDGKQADWSNPSAPVTVSIPYTPTEAELANLESIVIWFIDGSGNAVSVPNGHYDAATGTVTFTTTHFSYYAVGYDKVSFTDVTNNAWYSDAVGFIAARGITAGTGNGKFSPGAKLTRGEFIVMLMRAFGINPNAELENNFSDAGNTFYTGYLAAAKRLGISSGVGNNMFAPVKEITRQEMFTLLCNALKVIGEFPKGDSGKKLSDFTDAGEISYWAKDAMMLMIETGVIKGNDGKLNPHNTATRAEMAQVLYNLLSK